MNCKDIQHVFLVSEDPADLPPEVQAHVDVCPTCKDWQRRLVQIERHIPLLPVPHSSALAGVQRRILSPRTAQRTPSVPGAGPWRWQLTAAGLAATIVFCVLGLWALQGPDGGSALNSARNAAAPDPLLASLLQRNLDLAKAVDIRQQVEALALMAGDLSGEARPLAAASDGEGLEKLAGCYGRLIRDGVVERARALPAGQDPAFLNEVSDRLARAGADADRAAQEFLAFVPGEPVDPVRDSLGAIAAAAREGSRQLRALTGEKAANAAVLDRPRVTRLPSVTRLESAEVVAALLLAPASAVPLTVAAAVDARPAAPGEVDQARRFQRNCGLILALVSSGIRLAAEVDPLKRADQCNGVAERLAQEIQQAARTRDGARAVELGQHYRSVLKGGVAANLTRASRVIQPGSTGELEMRRIGAETVAVSKPLQDQLQRAAEDLETRDDMQRAWQAVFDGRSEVERAVGNPVPPRSRARDTKSRPS